MGKNTKVTFCNFPFTEGEKKTPIFIGKNDVGQFIYPDPPASLDFSDLNYMYLSTSHITVCIMEIGPGGFFNPPDYHPGDEAYFVLTGKITQFNPLTGQCIQVPKNDALLIPKKAMHSAYNFENESVKVLAVIAPKIVEDQAFPTDTTFPKVLYGTEAARKSAASRYDEPRIHRSVRDLDNFPMNGELQRKESIIYHIKDSEKLLVINGDARPVLMKFSVSNDFMDLGEYIIPTSGVIARYSEPIQHEHEALLFCPDENPVTVTFPNIRETYVLESYDAVYVPAREPYQIINYGSDVARLIYAVAKNGD